MNIFEYFNSKIPNSFTDDGYGNILINNKEAIELVDMLDHSKNIQPFNIDNYDFVRRDLSDKLLKVDIVIDESKTAEPFESISYTRRPYYRMRGHSVTPEQAFDIIRRTDNLLSSSKTIGSSEDCLGSMNFDNWLLHENHYPKGYGWIHVDGTVGTNAITQKYPTKIELLTEWCLYKAYFPYLDLAVAITDWDELPSCAWENDRMRKEIIKPKWNKNFEQGIKLVIYLYDNKVEILTDEPAIQKYREYNTLYGTDNYEKFDPSYYQDNNITQVDSEYFKKLIESYGITLEQGLQDLNSYEYERKLK